MCDYMDINGVGESLGTYFGAIFFLLLNPIVAISFFLSSSGIAVLEF